SVSASSFVASGTSSFEGRACAEALAEACPLDEYTSRGETGRVRRRSFRFTEATMRKLTAVVSVLAVMVGWTAAAQEPKAGSGDSGKIARAMSAAPPEISRKAAVMEIGADGKMKHLREGTNGWVCMLEPNGVPMCLDKEWQGWADAWVNKKD